MADKGKKKGGGDKAAKKSSDAEKPAEAEKPKAEALEAHAHDEADQDDDHDHADHDHADGHGDAHAAVAHGGHDGHGHDAHGHKPNIKEYFIIFGVLTALTLLEVGLAKVPGIGHKLMALGLIGLALTKAVIVAFFYMHLKHETKVLKLTVALPLATPAIYALVLISEAAWRLAR
jgi:cytochrome c oxidase subunit 4